MSSIGQMRLDQADLGSFALPAGANIAAATPYAESVDETAAVEGGLDIVDGRIRPDGPVRFGVPAEPAHRLLEAREFRPDLRAAIECRIDDSLRAAMAERGWPVVGSDAQNDETTMDRLGDCSIEGLAVIDHGETATLLGPTPETLVEEIVELAGTL